MKEDRFFSEYRSRTLILRGRIRSLVRVSGRYVAIFETGEPFGARCDLGPTAQRLHAREEATLVSEGAAAGRGASFVFLADCVRAS